MAEVWRMPEERPFTVIEHTPIPMADGVRLSARLWRPDGDAPVPVVLEYIPYRKRDRYRGVDDAWGPVLARHGFAFARVDVRGSGDSEGVLTDEYSEPELADGEAVIAWLAAQPWCNGAVGMRGLSWGGINTLQIAARRPPALKAIMPMGCCTNRFTGDAHYIGGALGRTNFQWGAAFKTVMSGPPHPEVFGEGWRAAWLERLEATPPILQTWLSHQRFDDYWQRGSVSLNLGAIACPTYIVCGLSDAYTNAVDELLAGLSVPRKGLLGPWGHTYPYLAAPQGLDWKHEELRWWTQWLLGEDTGILDEPMLRAFMPYASAAEVGGAPTPGRWIAEAEWPSGGVWPTAMRFTAARPIQSDGLTGVSTPEWLNHPPLEQSADDLTSVLFQTDALDEDAEILGRPRVRLKLTLEKPVAQAVVRLTEVTDDDRSWLVGYAVLNLPRHRSHVDPSALTPGETVDVALDLPFMARRLRKGSRLRLAISDGLWPMVWPAPGDPGLGIEPPELYLPVRPEEAEPAPFPIPERPREAPAATYDPPRLMDRQVRLITESRSQDSPRGAGTTLSRHSLETSAMAPGDPSSACWGQTITTGWKGDGFDCAVEVGYALTSDAMQFHLSEFVVAREGGAVVFERRTHAAIPRDLA